MSDFTQSLCPSLETHIENNESKLQKIISSGSSGSFLALFSVRDPLCPFAIPADSFFDPAIIWKREQDIGYAFNPTTEKKPHSDFEEDEKTDLEALKLFSKDIKLAIQFLAGSAQRRMTKWTQMRVVLQLTSIINTCSALNLDIFSLHFWYPSRAHLSTHSIVH